MATMIEKTGKTIEDAINAAVAELGVERRSRLKNFWDCSEERPLKFAQQLK